MFSRRQFLQAAGITIAASAQAAYLPRLALTVVTPNFDAIYGRAFVTAPIYAAPDFAAPISTRLWSDSITPILATEGVWYRLPTGYAPRTMLQPLIAPVQRSDSPSAPPFWVEVTAALAVVRATCAADAPIVARIGHGGNLRVIDFLPSGATDHAIGWYGVADNENGVLIGWTQTPAWSPVEIDYAKPSLTLHVDSHAQRLEVRATDRVILMAPISTGRVMVRGEYLITERCVSATTERRGAAWLLDFGHHQQLSGVYWHNQFGSSTPGTALQVMPALAKWLFPRTEKVIVY